MDKESGCLGLGWLALAISCVAGWVHHLVICFREGEWGFLIAGALFFPVAVVHGWGRWLGFW